MSAYSDYVLAERPWAYWDLSDIPIDSTTPKNIPQSLIDISGNGRHLADWRSSKIKTVYYQLFNYDYYVNFADTLGVELSVPVDLLPIHGIDVNQLGHVPTPTENNKVEGWISVKNYHINDVSPEKINISRDLFFKKVRCEFLLSLPHRSCVTYDKNPNCKTVKYPILEIGGMSLWVETPYFNPGCPPIPCPDCIMGFSRIAMYYNINVKKNHLTDYRKNRRYTEFYPIIGNMGILFPVLYPDWTRVIIECEYINDRSIHIKYWQKNYLAFDQIVTLPEFEGAEGYIYYKTFSYTDDWKNVKINCSRGISNISIFYDRHSIDNDYLIKSWDALTHDYTPQICLDTITISSQHITNIKLESMPNLAQKQLDSLLVRGISHKRFSLITSEVWDGGSKVKLWLGTYNNRLDGNNQIIQDFNIGDIISLSGSSQQGLDGCWPVEELYENGVAFLANQVFDDENGYFIIKRAPVGGGAWNRSSNMAYKSQSTSENELSIMDHNSSNYSTLWIGLDNTKTVFWNKLLKRTNNYLGEDVDNNESYWSIIGDNQRFIFVIAFKQNSTTHSRILAYGDFIDPRDNVIKTMLIGYNTNQIADVGFNKIFEYSDGKYSDQGELILNNTDNNQASNIGWIYSNKNGDVDYLHGVKDSGQHRYLSIL